MPALKNQKHEAVALLMAKAYSALEAYRKVYKCSAINAKRNAWRVKENEGIKKRMEEIQQAAKSATVMDMSERRIFLAETKRNPEYDIKDRMAAVMHDAKLAGELMDRRDLTTSSDAPLPQIVPHITINIPAHFAKR